LPMKSYRDGVRISRRVTGGNTRSFAVAIPALLRSTMCHYFDPAQRLG
jgi:hypothetical protein